MASAARGMATMIEDIAPVSRPELSIDAEGWLDVPGTDLATFVHTGMRMAAWPRPDGHGGIVLLRGGIVDDPAYDPEMLALSLSAEGLLHLSSDLNQLVFELLGNVQEPALKRPPIPGDVANVLLAASYALRSYQHGNTATDLAAGVAETIDQTLERLGIARASAPIDIASVI